MHGIGRSELNVFSISSITNPLWHPVLEVVSYIVAGVLYRRARSRSGDSIPGDSRMTVIVAAAIGAAVGSKLLHHLASPAEAIQVFGDHGLGRLLLHFLGGKTIVGALLGAWFLVEIAKRRSGITTRTGDLFVFPLIVGTAIGRLGCLFAGPHDDTLGVATTSLFGVDFGDGVFRHPAPLYDIAFLGALGALLHLRRASLQEGGRFRVYLFGYLSFRFVVDFLKPYEVYGGLRVIQWACLLGLVILTRDFVRPCTVHQQTS